jgi:hypothetical protein
VTDEQGNYTFANLDQGNYEIILGDVSSPGVAGANAVLSLSTTAVTADITVPLAGLLSGTVYQPGGEIPQANSLVVLSRDGTPVASAVTDDVGHFSFVVTTDGSFDLHVVDQGYRLAAIRDIVVSGGTVRNDLDFVSQQETIQVEVTSAETDAAVVDATIALWRTDAGPTTLPFRVPAGITDISGTFTFSGASLGDYVVSVLAEGYAETQRPVTVTAGANLPIQIALQQEQVVSGTVRSADTRAPVQDAMVQLISDSSPLRRTTYTAETGAYRLAGLPKGTYSLLVSSPSFASALVPGIVVDFSERKVDVDLENPNTRLAGKVTGPISDRPVVLVTATSAGGFVLEQVTTDGEGSYEMTTLPPGDYRIQASATGYLSSARSDVSLDPGVPRDVDLQLTAAAVSDPPPFGPEAESGGGKGGLSLFHPARASKHFAGRPNGFGTSVWKTQPGIARQL